MDNVVRIDGERAALKGVCSADDSVLLRRELELLIRRSANASFEINFKELESVNSALLSAMLSCVRTAESVQCHLSFVELPQKLYDMARVGGLEALLPIERT